MEIQEDAEKGVPDLLQLELSRETQKEGEEMTITKCDRCGQQINGVMLIRLHAGYGEPFRGLSMDLCDACMKDLRRWADERTGTKDQGKS